MAPATLAQGVITFLFTDIVGSTRMWERDAQAARQALVRHDAIVLEGVRAHRGRMFKTVGDACCCAFQDPADAVRAAISIQRGIAQEAWPGGVGSLQIRIAIHTGEAVSENGDYFGPALNRVARLVSSAHGGQIVASAATAALAERELHDEYVLVDLGAHRFKDLAEPQHVYQVGAAGLNADFPAIASLDSRPNNLPSQLSVFVGRTDELRRIREELARSRLVTICGVGGAGKTRLALQTAAEIAGAYADGTWLVRLADSADASLAAPAIASALHVTGVQRQSALETVAEHLREKHALLLLDNAEHLLPDIASIAHTLLTSCAGLRLLVTSREPLHVAGERVVRIGSLEGADAEQLFVERANLASSDRYVHHMCEELEGLPLAIELAAGRIGALSTKQLDERLHAMLPGVVSKDASQEPRHRTLEATIGWSYRLLNPKEQRFFALLGIFEGGFALEAAQAVAWAGEEDDPAYALLDALVDKSFVAAEPCGESMRYRLLESLHRFACAKLAESGDLPQAHRLHFEFFKALADRWGTWKTDEEEQAYLAAFERELPNLRAALEWGLAQPQSAAALELTLRVALYWQQHCNTAEGRSWLERASAIAAQSPGMLYAKLLRRAATFATIEDDYGAARDLTARASDLFRQLGDDAGTAEALHNLAVIEQRSGSEERALDLYREALALFERTGHEIGIITALYNVALTLKRRGDVAQAEAYLDRGMALCAGPQHADRLGTFWMLRGEIALYERRFDEASRALSRALEIKRELKDRHDEVEALCNIAVLEMRRGDPAAAGDRAREAIALAAQLEVPSLLVACFEVWAVLLHACGQDERARELAAAANGLRSAYGYAYSIVDGVSAELASIGAAGAAVTGKAERCAIVERVLSDHFV